MSDKVLSNLKVMLLGVTLGGVLLIAANCIAPPRQFDSAAVAALSPRTTEELVSKAQLIFIGEVGPVVQHRTFSGYGPNGELLDGVDIAGNPAPTVPITDFEIKVEQVLKDDGTIAGGKPVILRMGGDATVETKNLTLKTDYPFSFTGDRHLFLLTRQPDGVTYGFQYGPWSRLLIDGDVLRISNREQQLLKFDDRNSPLGLTEFMAIIKELK